MDNFNRRGRNPNNRNTNDNDRKKATAASSHRASPSEPQWRSVAMAAPAIPRPTSFAGSAKYRGSSSLDVIDKESHLSTAVRTDFSHKTKSDVPNTKGKSSSSSITWFPTQLQPIPPFYPLERSSRLVEEDVSIVVERISEANRLLSIRATYCNETATASLLTSENVEMRLSLWNKTKFSTGNQQQEKGIVIEIQRCKGDSFVFHRYSRYILDAAAEGLFGIQNRIKQNAGEDIIDVAYIGNNVHQLVSLQEASTNKMNAETEIMDDAVSALEITHGLLMKDRIDSRQLGLENLCSLTDPKNTRIPTALVASRAVLLGTTTAAAAYDLRPSSINNEGLMMNDDSLFQEIRHTLLSSIQLSSRISDGDDEFDEMDDNQSKVEDEAHITRMRNLALVVLANALHLIANEDLSVLDQQSSLSSTLEEDEVPSSENRTSHFDDSKGILERFLEYSGENNCDVMKILITEVGKARSNPHNAWLSAKSIGSLCRASTTARNRAKELGANSIFHAALDVGTGTHFKLERECDNVLATLLLTVA